MNRPLETGQMILKRGALLLVFASLLLLLGWVSGFYPFSASGASTKPLTGLAFLLLGLALVATGKPLVRWFAGAALLCSVLGLALTIFTNQGLYQPGYFAAGVSPPTAYCIFLASLALLQPRYRLGELNLTELCGLLIFPVAVMVLLGSLFGMEGVAHSLGLPGTALPTGFLILLLAVLLVLYQQRGLIPRLLGDKGPAGLLLRGALPVIVFLLPFLAWLRLSGEQAGWYDLSEGLVYMIGSVVVLMLALSLLAAWRIARLDEARAADYNLLNAVVETSGNPILSKISPGVISWLMQQRSVLWPEAGKR